MASTTSPKTAVIRVPDTVHDEARRIAALRGTQAGALIAEAWSQYMQNHREQFAADLEHAAQLLRDGTTEQIAAFVSGDADTRGEAAAKRARARRS